MDVYNFLNMVRGADGEEANISCLGADIDGIIPEYATTDWSLSLEWNSSFNKLEFKDSAVCTTQENDKVKS